MSSSPFSSSTARSPFAFETLFVWVTHFVFFFLFLVLYLFLSEKNKSSPLLSSSKTTPPPPPFSPFSPISIPSFPPSPSLCPSSSSIKMQSALSLSLFLFLFTMLFASNLTLSSMRSDASADMSIVTTLSDSPLLFLPLFPAMEEYPLGWERSIVGEATTLSALSTPLLLAPLLPPLPLALRLLFTALSSMSAVRSYLRVPITADPLDLSKRDTFPLSFAPPLSLPFPYVTPLPSATPFSLISLSCTDVPAKVSGSGSGSESTSESSHDSFPNPTDGRRGKKKQVEIRLVEDEFCSE